MEPSLKNAGTSMKGTEVKQRLNFGENFENDPSLSGSKSIHSCSSINNNNTSNQSTTNLITGACGRSENSSTDVLANLSDVEEEVFFGQMTEREKLRAKRVGKRRTAIYIPGFRERGSTMQYSQEDTPSGCLIIGHEVFKDDEPADFIGVAGDADRSKFKGVGVRTSDDIDSGVESGFSLLSLVDDPSLMNSVTTGRQSVGLNTGHLSLCNSASNLCEDVDQECGVRSGIGPKVTHSQTPLTTSSPCNCKSKTVVYCRNSISCRCVPSCNSSHSKPATELNMGYLASGPSDDPEIPRDITCSFDVTGSLQNDLRSIGMFSGENKENQTSTPLKKDTLFFPVRDSFNPRYQIMSPVPKRGNLRSESSTTKPNPVSKSIIPQSKILLNKYSAFSTYKSPSKYSPKKALSPSISQRIEIKGIQRMCTATQTFDGPGSEFELDGAPQFFPGLDGRMPGSPAKENTKSTYLSPISLVTRTTGEIWQDIVHRSDTKLPFGDPLLGPENYSSSSTQTDSEICIRPQTTGRDIGAGPRHLTGKRLKVDAVGPIDTPPLGFLNENWAQQLWNGKSDDAESNAPPRRKIFSELPVVRPNKNNNSTEMSQFSKHIVYSPIMSAQKKKKQRMEEVQHLSGEELGDLGSSSSEVQPDNKRDSLRTTPTGTSSAQSKQIRKGKVRVMRAARGSSATAAPTPSMALRTQAPTTVNEVPGVEQQQQKNQKTILSDLPFPAPAADRTSQKFMVEHVTTHGLGESAPARKTTVTVTTHRDRVHSLLLKTPHTPEFSSNYENSGQEETPQSENHQTEFPGNQDSERVRTTPTYFSPLSGDNDTSRFFSTPEIRQPIGRKICKPSNLSPHPLSTNNDNESISPVELPSGRFCLNIRTDIEMSPSNLDTITKVHTICNGQQVVEYLNCADSPMFITHYPPPRTAARVQWSEELEHEDSPSPQSPTASHKPILLQRPENFTFPFSDEVPSPILLTKTRRTNTLSQQVQHTQM